MTGWAAKARSYRAELDLTYARHAVPSVLDEERGALLFMAWVVV
jgi:hypothetical protein